MDSIVSKLSEIEQAAAQVVEHAQIQKTSLEKTIQEKRDQFDADLETETAAKISAIHSERDAKMSDILKKQERANSETIAGLNRDYEENHTRYAQEILKHIIEV